MIKYIFPLFFFISCNNENGINEREKIRIEGNFNSKGMEIGQWKYYTKDQKVIEEGFFENGVRVGKWKYYLPYSDSISWINYIDKNNSINTNIPDFLFLVESNNSVVSFKNRDSSRTFNLVIGKNYSTSFYSYKSFMYADLSKRNITLVDTASQYIETDMGKKYLYNYISATDSIGNAFYLFNIVGLSKNGELTEISLRCDTTNEDRGRKVFFSIIPNLFIGSTRFLLQKENITVFENPRFS